MDIKERMKNLEQVIAMQELSLAQCHEDITKLQTAYITILESNCFILAACNKMMIVRQKQAVNDK